MKITLTKRAERNFFSIKIYIEFRFGELVAKEFDQHITDFLYILVKFPQVGSIQVKSKQIRAFQITKQTSVFYRINDQQIIILAFFDVRQNPD